MITNPPFGVSWKSEEKQIINESKEFGGRFTVGTPRVSDGSLLFLQHLISKMESQGSRIGVVFNGSPLFSGDSGSGESEIRKWIIENDWLEGIVGLPEKMFLTTGIPVCLWIINKDKKEEDKNKVFIVDSSEAILHDIPNIQNKRISATRNSYLVNLSRGAIKLEGDCLGAVVAKVKLGSSLHCKLHANVLTCRVLGLNTGH